MTKNNYLGTVCGQVYFTIPLTSVSKLIKSSYLFSEKVQMSEIMREQILVFTTLSPKALQITPASQEAEARESQL
jgi:hypothetical protein